MRKLWKAAVPLALSAGLMLSALNTSAAPAGQFADIQGHWAQATLEQAYRDGIIKGTSDTAMSPNNSITKAQAVALLCRVLQVSGQGDTAGLNIPSGAWYDQDAAHGVYLGLLDSGDSGTLNQPLTRGEAFVLFSEAFQKQQAMPDINEALSAYSDGPYIADKDVRFAAANLVGDGVVNGIDGALKPDRSLTRAQFVTMLYRIADRFTPAAEYQGRDGSTVLSGSADLTGTQGKGLWFDQTASKIHLDSVDADWAIVRSDNLEELTVAGENNRIGTLVIAASHGDVDLTLPDTVPVDTVTVGSGTGNVAVNGTFYCAEVTGDHRTVSVDTPALTSVAVSGDNNTVTINTDGDQLTAVCVTGNNNTILLNGNTPIVQVDGRDNTIAGTGRAEIVNLFTQYCTVTVSHGQINKPDQSCFDLSVVSVRVEAPSSLPAGESLKATAHLTISEADRGKLCTGAWYLNGEKVQEGPVILGQGDPVSDISVNYTHDLQQEAALRYELTYVNNDGDSSQAHSSTSLYLENFSDLGLADASIQVTAPERLAPGETLSATAAVTSPETGKKCTGYWYVDGKQVSSGPVTLGAGTPYLNYNFDYHYGMPSVSEVTCKLVYTTEDGRTQEISGSSKVQVENYPDNGIAGASMYLTSVPTLAPGETLTVYAKITAPQAGKVCTGTWYVDGQQVATETVTTGQGVPQLNHKYKYTENMKTTSDIKFVLSCTTQDGRKQEVSADKTVTLQNYGYNYYHGPTDQEILKMVTNAYAGNYTTAWAQNHDYSQDVKTRWVNLKGYSSKSKYLIWVNLTYQRVNIFEGSQGNWKLIRTCLCGSGKPSTPTIKGVFATTYKQSAWSYGSYYCGPVVRFHGGYAFHSRLEYWPMGSGRFYDGRIGFPISHGCLRMYDDDIWFIYNNIPNGTTVVVH